MSEIPQEVRCDFDVQRVCPLRAAAMVVNAMNGAPENERPPVQEYDDALRQATEQLSKRDLERFYAMTEASGPTQDIRPGSCKSGPTRGVPLIGRTSCGSAIMYYVNGNGRRTTP